MVPVLRNEMERLRLLARYEILDTSAEPLFDNLAALAADLCDTPIGLIGFLDAQREWFKARVGSHVTELPRQASPGARVVADGCPVVIADTTDDTTLPLNRTDVHGAPIRFYAGVPVAGRDGHLLGTLCVMDTKPRRLSPRQLAGLTALAAQVSSMLELRLTTLESRRREQDLVAAAERLTLLQAERDELISFVIHDLKSPLSGIQMNAEFALERLPDEAVVREMLLDIRQQGDRVLRLLNDMLDIRRGRGRLEIRPVRVTWQDVAAELTTRFERRCALEGQRLEIVQGESYANLCADRQVLLRVLQNLLDNALKYARGGRVVVSRRELPDGLSEICVADEGPGIPATLRGEIFEPFVRVEGASPFRGQGLGLAFCRLAVRAHGGTITVEENQPRGTLFRIRLPPRPTLQAAMPLSAVATGWTSSTLSRDEVLKARQAPGMAPSWPVDAATA